MKKKSLVILILSLLSIFCFSACSFLPKETENKLSFKSIEFVYNEENDCYEGTKILSKDTTFFDFSKEITCVGKATYSLHEGNNVIPLKDKNVELTSHDTYFYVIISNSDEGIKTYKIKLHVNYGFSVTFYDGGGNVYDVQDVEEGYKAVAPEGEVEKTGYEYGGWDFDFNTLITGDTKIYPLFIPKTDTAYKINTYFQLRESDDYSDATTYNLTGTTDELISVKVTDYIEEDFADGYYIDTNLSNAEEHISGNGDTVLNVYFARKVYQIINKTPEYGKITCTAFPDLHFKFMSDVVVNIEYFMGCHFDAEKSRLLITDTNKPTELIYLGREDINIYLTKDDNLKDFTTVHTASQVKITDYDGDGGAVVVPDCVHEIGSYCFYNNDNIESLEIKHSWIKFEDFALSGMLALTSITLPDYVNNATLSNGLLFGCTALKTFTVPFNTRFIVSNALGNCTALEHINFNNNLETLGVGVFSTCDSLKELILPNSCKNFNGQQFVGLKSVERIVMPKEVNNLDYVDVINCPQVKSIVFPKNMTYFSDYLIYECPKLEYIVVGGNIQTCGYQNIRDVENNLIIYFEGTPEQLSNIRQTVETAGYTFGPCGNTVYCYSETEKEGYFHYDEKGIPVLW